MVSVELSYYYGYESEQFSFYRIPKLLFTDSRFANLSTDAKLLYGILLDRMSLSMKNGWHDEQGRVYIIFTLEDVTETLGYRTEKAIHPLSGLLFCKDCGAKMHIRIDYRNGGKRHVAYCSEYHKGKAKNPKCHSPHIMDADLLMQTIAEVLKKIEDYSISNRAEFEALVKKNLAMQQTDQTKKQQKRIPQITTRLEQIDKVLNKLYEDNALGTIPQDRYEQMSQKYSEEYYALKAELATLQEQLSAYENAGGRAQKFLKLTERHAAFTELTPAILNEFISRIEVHERDQKRARYAIQHISIYFNYIGKFENEVTQLAEPTEQEIRQMREEIEEAKKEKSRAYHRQYSREYRARNLEKQREYDRMKAREYRARRKAQAAAAQPTQ